MKNIIFCEVTCGRCGRAANSCGYYSPERIKKLKLETKTWAEDLQYRVLCPECITAVNTERSTKSLYEMNSDEHYKKRCLK